MSIPLAHCASLSLERTAFRNSIYRFDPEAVGRSLHRPRCPKLFYMTRNFVSSMTKMNFETNVPNKTKGMHDSSNFDGYNYQ